MEVEIFKHPVPAIVGQAVAGESAKVRQQLEQLIQKVNSSAFDIAELLHTIKKNSYYEGYTTFQEYTKTLEIKPRKAQYLRRIAEVMDIMEFKRAQYEPLGIAKLREITSLNVEGTWVNPETEVETPIKVFIQGFIEKGQDMTLEEIKNHVKTLKGLVGAEAMGWLHLYMKEQAIIQVARPALNLAKAIIGSVGKDDEGISKDASDGAAAESVFAAFLADPANEVLATGEPVEESNGTGDVEEGEGSEA
jgi:hypothetical protein